MRFYRLSIYITLILTICGVASSTPADDPLTEAKALMDEGDYETALTELDDYIAENPSDPLAYYTRGNCWFYLGEYETAIADFTKTIELDPTHYRSLNNRGLLLIELGEYERALEDFNGALEIKPDEEEIIINRGMLYREIGRDEEAHQDLDPYIEKLADRLNEGDETARVSYKLIELGDYSVAPILELEDTDITGVERAKIDILMKTGDDRAIPYFIEKLSSEDSIVSDKAVKSLVSYGERGVPHLLNLIETDADISVKGRAIYALSRIGGENVVNALTDMLEDHDELRGDIVLALAEIGDPRAIDKIIPLAEDSDPEFRAYVISQLHKFNHDSVVPTIINALYDENRVVRMSAVESLSKIEDERVIPELFEVLDVEEVPEVRYRAISSLGDIGDSSVIPELKDHLKSEDLKEVIITAKTLLRLDEEAVLPDLLSIIKGDDNPEARPGLITLFENYLDREEVHSTLITLLDDEDPDVVYETSLLFQKVGDMSVIPKLIDILNNGKTPELRSSVIRALTSYGTEEAIEEIRDALDDEDDIVVYYAVKALTSLEDKTVMPEMMELLGAENRRVRGEVIKYITNYYTPDTINKLYEFLEAENSERVVGAITALRNIGESDLSPHLLKLMEREELEIQLVSIAFLADYDTPEVINALKTALKDPSKEVVLYSMSSLYRIGDYSVIPEIIELLDREEAEIRYNASKFLLGSRKPGAIEAVKRAAEVETDEETKEKINELLERLEETEE